MSSPTERSKDLSLSPAAENIKQAVHGYGDRGVDPISLRIKHCQRLSGPEFYRGLAELFEKDKGFQETENHTLKVIYDKGGR